MVSVALSGGMHARGLSLGLVTEAKLDELLYSTVDPKHRRYRRMGAFCAILLTFEGEPGGYNPG